VYSTFQIITYGIYVKRMVTGSSLCARVFKIAPPRPGPRSPNDLGRRASRPRRNERAGTTAARPALPRDRSKGDTGERLRPAKGSPRASRPGRSAPRRIRARSSA
jgi:hypothetical protein